MSGNNKKYKKPQPAVKKGPVQPIRQVKPELAKQSNLKLMLMAGIAIITFICYFNTIHNQFTNWDDGLYVETNPYIKNLTSENWKMILFHNITNNYYHPITMITIAMNYHFSKMEPMGYYVTNIVMHIFNSLLTFLLIIMLLDAMEKKGYGTFKGKEWLAALGALCFGIHPMHVESVSWLAERKDVMYYFFYMLGLMAYVKYVNENKIKWMVYVVLLYLCSLGSKPLAVVFPFSLFAIDFLLKRSINAKLFLEKAPFFLVSLAGGIWAWHAQKASGAVASFHTFTFYQRIIFVAYGFTMYIAKAFVPFHLCSYYPYPELNNDGSLPFIYYLLPLIAVIIAALPILLSYFAGENYLRVTIFGLAFYFFNVMFVLQFVSSGPAVMADRYSYVSYFGIFFIVIYLVRQLWEKQPAYHVPVQAGLGVCMLIFGYITFDRTQVWHSTETLWRDVIQKYPHRIETSYKNLGNFYAEKGQMDSAYANYKIMENMQTRDAGVYSNIANIYGLRKDYPRALAYYSKALKLDSSSFDAYLDRAITYSMMDSFKLSLKDYNHAYRMDPNNEKLLENRAYTYLSDKQFQNSIDDYNKLIKINPDIPMYYFNRGVAESDIGNPKAALADFMISLNNDPKNANCIFDISVVYEQLKDYGHSLEYAVKAKQAGYPITDAYIQSIRDKVK
jgi:tetratricopeptide (TPR) repeat protein